MFNYDKVVMGCNISPCLVQMIMADVLQCIDIDCVYIDDILFSQQNKTLNEDYGSQQIPMTDTMKHCPPFLTKTNPTYFDDQYQRVYHFHVNSTSFGDVVKTSSPKVTIVCFSWLFPLNSAKGIVSSFLRELLAHNDLFFMDLSPGEEVTKKLTSKTYHEDASYYRHEEDRHINLHPISPLLA